MVIEDAYNYYLTLFIYKLINFYISKNFYNFIFF